MSDKFKEDLSALMDGELPRASASETVEMVLGHDELRMRWARYHVVRDVLRHKVYPDAGGALGDRVRACLTDEPHHLNPPRSGRWRDGIKPLAGLALAASVAVVAILGVRSLDPGSARPELATGRETGAAVDAPPVSGAPIPVASVDREDGRPMPLRRLHWSTDEPAVAKRLNGYLVSHSERRGGPMGGLHPYARIVGYDTNAKR